MFIQLPTLTRMNQRGCRYCGACGPMTPNSKLTFIHLDPLPDRCRCCRRTECLSTSSSNIFPAMFQTTKPLGEKFSNQHGTNPNTTPPWQSQLEMLDRVVCLTKQNVFTQQIQIVKNFKTLWQPSAKRLFMFCGINTSMHITWQLQMIWFNCELHENETSSLNEVDVMPCHFCELPLNPPKPT